MKTISKTLLTFIFISYPLLAAPEIDVKAQFKQALSEYKAESAVRPEKELLPFAKKLYERGQEYYQQNDVSLARLAHNYATVLNANRESQSAIPFLQEAILIFKNTSPTPNEDLISSLLELGKAYYRIDKHSKGTALLNEALIIAKKENDEILFAETTLKVAVFNISNKLLTKNVVKKSRRQLEAAYSIFKEANTSKQLETAFWLGKANLLYNKKTKATEYFELVIKNAENTQSQQYYAMTSHAFLVDAYSKLGEEKKATEHCQAIGEKQIWENESEPKPLYVLHPSYPKNAARNRKNGFVTLDFTIDSNGFTKNISVSQSAGGSSFENASKKVLKKWRFAPKFENGKAVDAKARYTMEYKLEN